MYVSVYGCVRVGIGVFCRVVSVGCTRSTVNSTRVELTHETTHAQQLHHQRCTINTAYTRSHPSLCLPYVCMCVVVVGFTVSRRSFSSVARVDSQTCARQPLPTLRKHRPDTTTTRTDNRQRGHTHTKERNGGEKGTTIVEVGVGWFERSREGVYGLTRFLVF